MPILNKDQIIALMGVVICIVMLFSAIPRTLSAFYMLYPSSISGQFKSNADLVSREQLIKAEKYTSKAISWFETGPIWQELALTKIRQLSFFSPKEQSALLFSVKQANAYSLSLSPVDPFAWYRQAIIEQSLGATPEKIINNIKLSCYAGRVEPDLLLKRVNLLYVYQAVLNDETRDVFYDQLRLASLLKFYDLVKMVVVKPGLLISVQFSLRNDPELLSKFMSRFEKINK